MLSLTATLRTAACRGGWTCGIGPRMIQAKTWTWPQSQRLSKYIHQIPKINHLNHPSSPPNPVPLHETPMVPKQSASASFTSSLDERDPRLILVGNELMNKIVGPMPAEEFLNEFLPAPNAKSRPSKTYQKEMTKVSHSKEEKEMYTPLVKAIRALCRNFTVVDAHDSPFSVFHKVIIRPDICIYPKKDTGDISKVEVMIEVKYRKSSDPFVDTPGKPLINTTGSTSETLGQIALYAAAHQAAQFRSYIFSLLVLPTYARILRWDRSGVIVTNQIPLSSMHLHEFFRRFNCMTAEQRGIDPTVTNPSRAHERRARQLLRVNDDAALIQLPVGDTDYIVPRDMYRGGTRSPLGRSTRAFFAYSLSLKKLVFLKDTWRVHSQSAEHDLYAKLKEKRVPYIATFLAGGDVLDQQTRTQDFVEKTPSWAKDLPKRLRKHLHYRLVLEEVGLPLTTFSSTKLLVKVMHEALIAHQKAYEEAKILHRDISPNNIMIYKGSALLIDWDLSKSLEDNQRARESERTGTWQFAAARLLDPETVGPQTITDDVESFVHVLTWTSFRYADHQMTKSKLTIFLQSVFDYSFTDAEGRKDSGLAKSRYLREPDEIGLARFKSKNLEQLLLTISGVISTRYQTPPSVKFGGLQKAAIAALQEDYQKKLNALQSSDWIIQTFEDFLTLDNWPEDDAAKEHELVDIPSRLKTSAPA